MSVTSIGMMGFMIPATEADFLRAFNLQPNFRPLPAIGTNARRDLLATMRRAFGPTDQGWGVINRDAIYDQLSQLAYQDRITLLRELFQGPGQNIQLEWREDAEAATRRVFLDRMARGTGQNPLVAGAIQFFQLMADAPQTAHYARLLRSEMRQVFLMGVRTDFTDRNDESLSAALLVFHSDPSRVISYDPYRRLRSIGIIPGNVPPRPNPLGFIAAPTYQALPAADSNARQDLVAQLVTLAGPMTTPRGGIRGFENPDAFFRLMANYNYNNRIDLFRDILRAQGRNDLADLPEIHVRRCLMFRSMHNQKGKMTFAGLDRFFRLVLDAPQDDTYQRHLRAEIISLFTQFDHRQFIDRNQPHIRDNYRRFCDVGAINPYLLTADPYSRLALIGLTFGRPPVLPPVPMAPVRMPAPPILSDRLDIAPDRPPMLGLPAPVALAFVASPTQQPWQQSPLITPYSPLAVV